MNNELKDIYGTEEEIFKYNHNDNHEEEFTNMLLKKINGKLAYPLYVDDQLLKTEITNTKEIAYLEMQLKNEMKVLFSIPYTCEKLLPYKIDNTTYYSSWKIVEDTQINMYYKLNQKLLEYMIGGKLVNEYIPIYPDYIINEVGKSSIKSYFNIFSLVCLYKGERIYTTGYCKSNATDDEIKETMLNELKRYL